MKREHKSLKLKKLTVTNLNGIEESKVMGGGDSIRKCTIECETPDSSPTYCYCFTVDFTCLINGCL